MYQNVSNPRSRFGTCLGWQTILSSSAFILLPAGFLCSHLTWCIFNLVNWFGGMANTAESPRRNVTLEKVFQDSRQLFKHCFSCVSRGKTVVNRRAEYVSLRSETATCNHCKRKLWDPRSSKRVSMFCLSSHLNGARWACTTGRHLVYTTTHLSGRVPLFLTRIRSQENSWGRLVQWSWWEPPHESPEKNELVSLSTEHSTRGWDPWSDVGSRTPGLLKLVTMVSVGESTLQIPTAQGTLWAQVCCFLTWPQLRAFSTAAPFESQLSSSLSFTVIKNEKLGKIFLLAVSISQCFTNYFPAASSIHLIACFYKQNRIVNDHVSMLLKLWNI